MRFTCWLLFAALIVVLFSSCIGSGRHPRPPSPAAVIDSHPGLPGKHKN